MKRVLISCLIVVLLYFIPVNGQDVADLEPIQTVWLSREGEQLLLKTDTEDVGRGTTVAAALTDMKIHSQGIVYLDTAQYLLVSETALDAVSEIRPYLKGKVRVCVWEGGDVKKAARYVNAREIGVKLRKWTKVVKLPKIPI